MARIKRAMNRRTRLKNLRRRVRGFFIGRRRLRQAIAARMKADAQMFIGRKQRKRQFRRLWNQRINAGARRNGLSYSKLIHGLKLAGIDLNRKMLAELAIHEPTTFASVTDKAKAALSA